MINKLCNKITNLNAPIVVGLDPMLDYVPEHVDLRSNGTYFGGGKKGDGRGIAIFFRKNGDSKTGHYGRLDFYWEDGVPVGIRRVLYSDTPGERYLRFSAQ